MGKQTNRLTAQPLAPPSFLYFLTSFVYLYSVLPEGVIKINLCGRHHHSAPPPPLQCPISRMPPERYNPITWRLISQRQRARKSFRHAVSLHNNGTTLLPLSSQWRLFFSPFFYIYFCVCVHGCVCARVCVAILL